MFSLPSSSTLAEPQVRAGHSVPTDLSESLNEQIVRVAVDTHLHLPDMFEITFYEPDLEAGTASDEADLQVGCKVEVLAADPESTSSTRLILGEITSVEAVCEEMTVYTVIRGYDASHRLQRARRTRTFVNLTDADIATQVAREAGLSIGSVKSPSTRHPHVSQVAESDWDFLQQRARALGLETGVKDGKFFFGTVAGTGGSSPLSFLDAPPELAFGDDLLSFRPRVSAATLTPKVEVRSWNPDTSSVVVATATTPSGDTVLDSGASARQAAEQFSRISIPTPSVGDAPAPAADAYVVVDCSANPGAGAAAGADAVAKGLAEQMARSHTSAVGTAMGNAAVQAGTVVEISGVPKQFSGRWRITCAQHVFSEDEGGYRTRFEIGGNPDRPLFGGAAGTGQTSAIQGLVCALVTNINDPTGRGRVKVRMPWLAPEFETDWARVAQAGAGASAGALMMPEVDDEVLVGFELGDPRRPFVLGGLLNKKSSFAKEGLGGPVVRANGETASVTRRGLVSSSGNRLAFTDVVPPTGGRPSESSIVLGTRQSNIAVAIDQVAGTLALTCKPSPPDSSKEQGSISITCGAKGTITLDAGSGGTVNVNGGANGRVTIDGGAMLSLKATQELSLESSGQVKIKGQVVTIAGTPIKLN